LGTAYRTNATLFTPASYAKSTGAVHRVDRRTGSATICAGAILQSECRGNQSDHGPGEGYDWPDTEHGLFVDHQRWTGSTSTRSSSIRTVLSGPSRRALAFSPDAAKQFLYVGDYDNGHIHIVNRKTLQVIGSIGSLGPSPGDFRGLHMLATDSKGNLWTAETQPRPTGSRVQRFVFKGVS
jgi:DNA-binding beta-propeller fold protein YncE